MVTENFDFDFSLTLKLPRSPWSPRSDCPKNRVCVSSVGAIESLDDFELIDVWYMSRGQKLLEPHTIKVAVTPESTRSRPGVMASGPTRDNCSST